MKKREPALAILIVLLGLFAALAVLGRPVGLWFTEDQQAERLAADEKYTEAAELYKDPMRQGVAYFRGGEFEAAAGAFARVDEPEAAFDRGNALVMLGKYDDAIASYDRALQFQPDWTEAQQNRAIAVARRDKTIPVTYTEEVWVLGERLPLANILAVLIMSITIVALFVYYIFYRDHLRGNVGQFLLRVLAGYGITLVVVVILTMFQKLPWQTDPAIAIRRIILVAFPACFSATVVDSLR